MSENVSDSMADALDKAGLTDEVLAEKHVELANKREVVFVRNGKDSHHELTDQPDTFALRSALDMAYKLKGSYAAERYEHTGKDGTPLIIERPPADGAKKAQAPHPPG